MTAAIERFDTVQAAATAAAAHIAAVLASAIAARGAASFVATGGRTPGSVYDALSRAPLDWSRVVVTLSDERWVDEDHPDSNARLVRERLLVGAAARARFIGLKTDDADPHDAEDEVEARLAAIPWPFDMLMLGMGDDGHVASLFPGGDGGARRCIAVAAGGPGRAPMQPRMSLTLPAITVAREGLILIAGAAKWAVLQAALCGDETLPVEAVLAGPAPVRVVWSP